MSTLRDLRPLVAATAVAAVGAVSFLAVPAASAKGGTGGGGVPPAALQADWPATVPVPAGTITGTSGTAPSETVALVVEASYPDVVGRVTALYTGAGFSQAADGTLAFSTPAYRVTVAGSARDHSATRTNVVVWLSTL